MSRRTFGALRNLEKRKGKPGRWQASYRCPEAAQHPTNPSSRDGKPFHVFHPAHDLTTGRKLGTFTTKGDAETYLTKVRAAILEGRHVCPVRQMIEARAADQSRQTFRKYAETWLRTRRKTDGSPLTERTRLLYRRQLDELLETFGDLPLDAITTPMVRSWWKVTLPEQHPDRLTGNAHVYALLRTILATAVEDELLTVNPCNVKGAGVTRRRKAIKPATPDQLAAIASAASMPDRYRLGVLLAGWCALRFGEMAELRRRDVAPDGGTLSVQRAMTYEAKRYWVGEPKAGSKGEVAVPPHLRRALLDHVRDHAQPGPDGLLFWRSTGHNGACECGHHGCTGGHIFSQWFHRHFRAATEEAGRPDLTFHELRHTGSVLAAEAGASLADQMKRLRHSTHAAALRYQHAVDGRDAELAERMSRLADPSAASAEPATLRVAEG